MLLLLLFNESVDDAFGGTQSMRCSSARCCIVAGALVLALAAQLVLRSAPVPVTRSARARRVEAGMGASAEVAEGSVLLDAGRLQLRVDSRSGILNIKTSRGTLVATSSAASPYVRSGGRMQQLVLKVASTSKGCDALGCFTAATLTWRIAHAAEESTVVTIVRAYAALEAIVFSTRVPSAVHGTSSGRPCGFIGGPAAGLFNDCGLALAFPRLSMGDAYRQWLSWAGGPRL